MDNSPPLPGMKWVPLLWKQSTKLMASRGLSFRDTTFWLCMSSARQNWELWTHEWWITWFPQLPYPSTHTPPHHWGTARQAVKTLRLASRTCSWLCMFTVWNWKLWAQDSRSHNFPQPPSSHKMMICWAVCQPCPRSPVLPYQYRIQCSVFFPHS
jgi:hypothetical protein